MVAMEALGQECFHGIWLAVTEHQEVLLVLPLLVLNTREDGGERRHLR